MGFHLDVWLKVNSLVCVFGFITYWLDQHGSSGSIAHEIAWAYLGACVRNGSLVAIITILTRSQPPLAKAVRQKPTWSESIEMLLRMLGVACMDEAFSLVFIKHVRGFAGVDTMPIPAQAVHFVIHLFLFELVFDLCHYWVHRLCHEVKWLYRHTHKLHHKLIHPTPLGTYMQDPADVLLSNVLPLMVACWSLPRFTELNFHRVLAYKVFVEIAGHTGTFSRATSFPICPPLPAMFGFALVTADHDLHHTQSKYNYSKRFILWDRVFGTYKQPPERHIPVK